MSGSRPIDANLPQIPIDTDLESRKRQLAYQFWEDEGRPEGQAEAHWERACLVLMSFEEDAASDPLWLKRHDPAQAQTPQTPVTPTAETGQRPADPVIDVLRQKIAARTAA
jgi:Protein of unknown function (DUF2934)